MIICISPEDHFVLNEVAVYANQYNEKHSIYGPNCLKDLGNDSRITFVGHGDTDTIGNNFCTPEIWVADLISFGIPAKCTIDLVSCGGDISEERGSYAERALRVFIRLGYSDIQINYLSNAVSTQSISLVSAKTGPANTRVVLSGLTPTAKIEFDAQLAKAPYKHLEATVKVLQEEKLQLKSKIRDFKIAGENKKHEIQQLQDEINTLEIKHATYEKLYRIKKRREIIELYEKLGQEIYRRNSNIRHILDDNANFQNTVASLAESSRLTLSQKHTIRILNNRIAELKHIERENRKAPTTLSYVFNLFYSSSTEKYLSYQIEKLETYIKQIKTITRDGDILAFIQEGANDEKLQNANNYAMLEKLLAIFSLGKECIPTLQKSLAI